MGVYIRRMEMPSSCEVCPLNYDSIDCVAADNVLRENGCGDFLFHHERHPNCPLILVPEHGRLIDADALINDYSRTWSTYDLQRIANAPTIIPADDPKEETE